MLRLIDRGAKRVASSELNLLKYELQGHLWTMREAVTIEKIKNTEIFIPVGNQDYCQFPLTIEMIRNDAILRSKNFKKINISIRMGGINILSFLV